MIAAEKWKDLWWVQREYGSGRETGIKISIVNDREPTEAEKDLARDFADKFELLQQKEDWRLNPEIPIKRAKERETLLALFGGWDIFVEEIPNGYGPPNDPYSSHFPWYKVTTKRGIITLGWRRRVISIEWSSPTLPSAVELFPNEDVTKWKEGINTGIHAWSLEKAQEYINKILGIS